MQNIKSVNMNTEQTKHLEEQEQGSNHEECNQEPGDGSNVKIKK